MEKVIATIYKSEKGFYVKGNNIPFGLVDRNSLIPLQEGEEWEMVIVRSIVDKRGREVPILRPVKKVYKFDEYRGVFTCGTHTVLPSSISVKEMLEGIIDHEIKGEVTSPEGENFPFTVSWHTFQKWESVPEDIVENVKKRIEEIENKRKEEFKKFLAEKKEQEFNNFLEFLRKKILESEEKAFAEIESLREKIKVMHVWKEGHKSEEEKNLVRKHSYFISCIIDPDTGEIKDFNGKLASLKSKIERIEKELSEWKNVPLEEKIKITEEDTDIKVQIFRFIRDEFLWETWSFVKDWLFSEE